MKKPWIIWLLCAALVLGLCPVRAAEGQSFRFDDVADEGAYYFAPVYWAYGHDPQITTGVSANAFKPENPCTRAQVVTFLWRAEGKPQPEGKDHPFSDVDPSQYYSEAVLWAVETGVTTGTSTSSFSPENTCSRAQIVTFLWRNAGSPEPETADTAFTDVDGDAYYSKAVAWALEKGITTGATETSFRPEGTCTRAQIVTFLYRASQIPDGPDHEHDYKAEIAAPTCTEAGFTTYTCTRCGDSYVGDEVPALGHDYQAAVTAPTCTEAGVTTFTCTRCGDTYVTNETDALGHDWGEGEVTKQPTETEQGERTYTCARCGEQRTEPIPELTHVHDFKAVVNAPTCTEEGFTTYTCACGESYRDSEVPALGHSFGEWTTNREATCTVEGEQTHVCARCGEKETRKLDALGHDYKAVVTAPTCTEKGYTTYTCTRCGDAYTGSETAALGHDYKAVVTAPTCTEKGYTTYTCSRCSDTYTGGETAALGHAYENGVCTRCGEADPDYVEPGPEKPVGYLAAAPFGEGFIACGTGGRIDYISTLGKVTRLDSGTEETLRSVYTDYPNILIGGDRGTVLISTDAGESFMPMNIGASIDVYGAVEYNGMLYCAGSGGSIYRMDSNGWKKARLSTTNDVISLVITNHYLVAVTAETDVFYSENGSKWEETNFNEEYHGLYPEYVFTRAVGAGETFFVLGYEKENPNIPLIMYTESGEVWMQLMLNIVNGEYLTGEENMRIHDICFNTDQIVGMLDGGRILAITDCFKCNEEKQLDQTYDLWATAIREEGVLVCGEDFFCRVLGRNQIRQDKIAEEQAYYDVQRGALLIDVRTASERAGGYVKGSIHIPLAQLADKLPEIAPDPYTEIIFYCASGRRAQTATEQALDMGYRKVYNLGGLSDIAEGYFEIVKE